MNSFDWDDLRLFLAMTRAGSLSAAARHLGVEHSTVSRRLTRLERSLDAKIFNRMSRGWSLTTEGEALLERAALLEGEIRSIVRVPLQKDRLAGCVRVSAPPALLSAVIVPALPEFVKTYPQISLQSVGEFREADLSRGEADIALRMAEPTGADLVTRTVGHIDYSLYGNPKWAALPEDERVFIGFLPEAAFWLARELEAHVGDRLYVLRSNDIHVILRAATEGLGIALLPRFLGDTTQSLVPMNGLSDLAACPISLVMQRDVRHAPRVRAVADFLVSKLSASRHRTPSFRSAESADQ